MNNNPTPFYTGTQLNCRGWVQEAALRMLLHNLHPDVAEDPESLVVYGGSGKAARNHECLEALIRELKTLEDDQTLLVQSGKPVAVFPSHKDAPRILIANSNLVGDWANWNEFRRLEAMGLTMFGQMTAGSWIYIGSQGIVQGTYETLIAAAKKHFNSQDLHGRLVVTAGLGGMGGAQPLAITMAQGVALVAEVDSHRAEKRLKTGYLDEIVPKLEDAVRTALSYKDKKRARSIAWIGNASDLLKHLVINNIVPDIVTDQTSAHDMLNGYVPDKMSYEEAKKLRQNYPHEYTEKAQETCARHVKSMLDLQKKGSIAFDYGNNIRTEAKNKGIKNAFDIPGFVPEYIRPLFCEGQGPFRWVALSGDPEDIYTTDAILTSLFPQNEPLCKWLEKAKTHIKFQGLPSRICWLGYGDRQRAGKAFNDAVKSGKIKAPIVIGRDHLDTGSVASPYRETEGMRDGSDAIADWPILNALINAVNGASWVSFHHGGGVGIGKSLHAGMVIVADGTDEAEKRLARVLTSDPGSGVVRHVDAGYPEAIAAAKRHGIHIPMP